MPIAPRTSPARRGTRAAASAASLVALSLSLLVMALTGGPSSAATAVNLGTAEDFGILAGSAVTNTGNSVIAGDLGVSPDASVSGFPPGQVLGTIHAADAVAAQAQTDLTTAYNAVAAQPASESISADLAGRTLTSGVFNSASSLGLSGELTLDAQGDPNAVFIFQAGSTLTTASGSSVTLINGAQACNVYWQVGSSATLGTHSTFLGTVLALTSISAGTGATVEGRLLARNGAVTLDDNTITPSSCRTPPTDVPTTDTPTTGTPTPDEPTTDVATSDGPVVVAPVNELDAPPADAPEAGGPDADAPDADATADDAAATGLPTGDLQDGSGTGQVSTVPKGAPDTGDGGSVRTSTPWLLGAGSVLLGLAGAGLLWWRRTSATG